MCELLRSLCTKRDTFEGRRHRHGYPWPSITFRTVYLRTLIDNMYTDTPQRNSGPASIAEIWLPPQGLKDCRSPDGDSAAECARTK